MRRWCVAAAIVALAGIAWAGWDEARSKAEAAKRKGEKTEKKFVQGTKKIVGAMCNARDFEVLRDAGRDTLRDARSDVRAELDDFHRAIDDALAELERIDSNDSHHYDASSLASELRRLRDDIDNKTSPMVQSEPDYIDGIVRAVDSARSDHKGNCSQRDFTADGERVRCIIKQSDTCYVVVDAVDNGSAISAARDKARRLADAIRNEEKRDSPTREVNGCVHVEPRVDCLKVCPDVGDDGRVGSIWASWRERCDY